MNYIPFKIESKFSPTGDQPRAIKQLCEGLKSDKRVQVLLGATGTGKLYYGQYYSGSPKTSFNISS